MTKNVQINPENLELQKGMFSLRELKTDEILRNNLAPLGRGFISCFSFTFCIVVCKMSGIV